MTQYAYTTTGMISYDDERAICDKTEYAQVHGLNGYIIWELSGDLFDDFSTPLLDAANAKLLDPSLDCASLDLSTIGAVMNEMHITSQGASADAGPELVFYPAFGEGLCLSDGNHADWLQLSDMTNSAEVSCFICRGLCL